MDTPLILRNTLYYLFLPVTNLFWLIVGCLAPILHLGHYIFSACLFPVTLVAKLETLYIYLGVAAVIGLVTGSILHLSSSVLVSVFNLAPAPEETGRSAASFRAAREKKKFEKQWPGSTIKSENGTLGNEPSMEKYAEWLEKSDHGLLSQTILEEEDSEGF